VRDNISIFRFGYTPAFQEPLTVLTSMFMHGSLGHLFGNMLFLFIFGFSLEVMLGRVRFLFLYLLTGVCATAMHTVFNLGSYVPCVGASGAISGLVGMYLAAWGLRKIQFFYFLGFWFGEFKAPALLIFPVWIGKEIYEQLTSVTNVAYMAHAGGLLGGLVLVLLLKALGWINLSQRYHEDEETEEQQKEREAVEGILEKVNAHFSKLDTTRAREACKNGLNKYPDSLKLWEKQFLLWKSEPQSRGFHETAFEIFKLARHKTADMKFIGEIMDEYLALTNKPAALNGPVSLLLAKKFKQVKDPERLEVLVARALELGIRDDAMPRLINYLVSQFERLDNTQKAIHFKNKLREHFPKSPA
ncbi:MAG: rhomboid family intramembrane serine protease, partial [Gammaproteobacteria bacterium]|nr:rhomboid family intramembrane serine protease [Gammaproteobacteria bacterium]